MHDLTEIRLSQIYCKENNGLKALVIQFNEAKCSNKRAVEFIFGPQTHIGSLR